VEGGFAGWLPGFYGEVEAAAEAESRWLAGVLPEQAAALATGLLAAMFSRIDKPFRMRLTAALAPRECCPCPPSPTCFVKTETCHRLQEKHRTKTINPFGLTCICAVAQPAGHISKTSEAHYQALGRLQQPANLHSSHHAPHAMQAQIGQARHWRCWRIAWRWPLDLKGF